MNNSVYNVMKKKYRNIREYPLPTFCEWYKNLKTKSVKTPSLSSGFSSQCPFKQQVLEYLPLLIMVHRFTMVGGVRPTSLTCIEERKMKCPLSHALIVQTWLLDRGSWLRLRDLQLQGFGFESPKLATDFTISVCQWHLVTESTISWFVHFIITVWERLAMPAWC